MALLHTQHKTVCAFITILATINLVESAVQNGHDYWNHRYSAYGVNHPQWNGFWYNDYKSIDYSLSTSGNCKIKITDNTLHCTPGSTTM